MGQGSDCFSRDDDGNGNAPPPPPQQQPRSSRAVVATARLAELTRIGCGTRSVVGGGDGSAPELVPFELSAFDTCGLLRTSWAATHLRWMLQKDLLGQVGVGGGSIGSFWQWGLVDDVSIWLLPSHAGSSRSMGSIDHCMLVMDDCCRQHVSGTLRWGGIAMPSGTHAANLFLTPACHENGLENPS